MGRTTCTANNDVRIYNRALSSTEVGSVSGQTGDTGGEQPPVSDAQAPTAPTDVTGRALSSSQIGLTWAASHDDVGVTGYLVYRNSNYIATTGTTAYTDTALQPATTYTYAVAAMDAAGNQSPPSSPVALTTDLDAAGLVAHWRLDEGNGSSASDDGAGGHTGMLVNGAAWAAGYHGGGVSFDGVNDYIALPVIDVPGSALTIAAWAKSASFGEQRFLSKATDIYEQSHYWMLSQFNDGQPRLRFRLKAGGITTTLIASTGTLPRDTWYHAAATYDGAAMRLYLNGVEVGVVAKAGILNTSSAVPVNIGRNPGGSNHLHGIIDDVRIYSRALPRSEISSLAGQPGGGSAPPSADTQPPAVPTGLTARAVSSSRIDLSWTASTDNVGVVGYRVYRNGTQIVTASQTSYADSGLAASSSYSYTVSAIDAAGNASPQSTAVGVATPAPAGAVTWSTPIAITGAPHVTTTITGDFNGDGIADIAAFEGPKHSGASLFAWFESPTFRKHEINPGFSVRPFMGSAAAADMNRDGRVDIVFSTDNYDGQEGWIYWAENPGGSATGSWPIHLIHYFPSGTQHINDMVVDDVDGDGKLDVVVRHLGVNRVRILFQDALPGSWTLATIGVKPREGLSVADLDGDGRKDLLLNGFWLAAPVNARTGTWTEYSIDPTFYTQPDTGLNNAAKTAVGDINRDGRIDVVISTAEGATGKFAWYSNPGNPRTQTWGVHVLESNSTGMHQAELGDIDNDGDLDVMNGFAFGATGIYAYLLDGTSHVRNTVTTATGLYFGKLADLDGDGDLDVVGPTGYGGQLYVYRNMLNTSP